jgi:hypothetical protein
MRVLWLAMVILSSAIAVRGQTQPSSTPTTMTIPAPPKCELPKIVCGLRCCNADQCCCKNKVCSDKIGNDCKATCNE